MKGFDDINFYKSQGFIITIMICRPSFLYNVTEQYQVFFNDTYEPLFQSMCDAIYDGIYTTDEMLVHLTDSGYGDMIKKLLRENAEIVKELEQVQGWGFDWKNKHGTEKAN